MPGLIKRLLIFEGVILLPIFIFELLFGQRAYPGVKIAQIPVGLKTDKEVQKIITALIKERGRKKIELVSENKQSLISSENKQSLISSENRVWEIDLEKLNLTYLPEKTTKKVLRQGCFSAGLKGVNFGIDYSINKELLGEEVATFSSLLSLAAIPPAIFTQGKPPKIVIEPGRDGQELEKEKLLNLIDFQIANLIDEPIVLPLKKITLAIDSLTFEKTKMRAEKLLGKKLKLQGDEETWEINGIELLNEEKIKEYVEKLSTSANQEPQEALFRFENGKVIAFRPEKRGTSIDKTKTVQYIKQGLEGLEASEEKEKLIQLPIQYIEPKVKIGEINRFGIIQRIGLGQSNFQGSIPNRIHNINLAANRLSGILILPGEEFSFNQALGEVSEKTGFKQAYIIKERRTILGDGGGICQVSTTLFRAALNAGLPILERHSHAYRVHYYEQDSAPGFDATVFAPSVDLKFKNDTPAYLLIQATIDDKSKVLKFELYGTDDNREVTLSKSRIWDQTPPPPDLYQDDPNLPVGVTKQVDWKAWGAKTAFDWKVTRGDEILEERTFYSSYQPWQAIFLRGTKQ